MSGLHRLTIHPVGVDPRAAGLLAAAPTVGVDLHGVDVSQVRVGDVVFLRGDLDEAQRAELAALIADPLLETGSWETPSGRAVEVALHPGVTDDRAAAVRRACALLGIDVDGAATARRIELPAGMSDADVDLLTRRLVANPVIEHWHDGTVEATPVASTQLAVPLPS